MNVALLSILLLIGLDDPVEKPEPPSAERLAAISRHGTLLAEYDRAAWHASDALQEDPPLEGAVEQYIARETDGGWIVSFGRSAPDGDGFLIASEATQGEDPDSFTVEAFDPPRKETGFAWSASRAIATALRDFTENDEGEPRPYNVAVLPAEPGGLWVYLVPAPTRVGVWPLGGDVRYLLSEDGSEVLEKRQLHKAVIEVEPPADEGLRQSAGMHTHILEDIPEDTDVFHVLTRRPRVPELIVTRTFVFSVDADGDIRCLGPTEEVIKK